MAYRKTRAGDPCGTLAGPYTNQNIQTWDPSGTLQKLENRDPGI